MFSFSQNHDVSSQWTIRILTTSISIWYWLISILFDRSLDQQDACTVDESVNDQLSVQITSYIHWLISTKLFTYNTIILYHPIFVVQEFYFTWFRIMLEGNSCILIIVVVKVDYCGCKKSSFLFICYLKGFWN